MKVHVEGNLYITSDERQFCLSELKETIKDGQLQEYFVHIGFYSSLEYLIKGLVKRKLNQTNATTLYELLQDLKRIDQYIREAVQV